MWCRFCIKELLEQEWGLKVTEEEYGHIIKFGDTLEQWDGEVFSLQLLYPNTPTNQPLAPRKIRSAPYASHPTPIPSSPFADSRLTLRQRPGRSGAVPRLAFCPECLGIDSASGSGGTQTDTGVRSTGPGMLR